MVLTWDFNCNRY